jgi:hypothetical protein
MTRAVLAALLLLAPAARAEGSSPAVPEAAVVRSGVQANPGPAFQDLLELSLKEKRGLTFRVKGKAFPGVVVRLFSASVEVRKPDHARVLIRLDRIESVALN